MGLIHSKLNRYSINSRKKIQEKYECQLKKLGFKRKNDQLKSKSDDQHSVTIGVKSVFVFDCFFIGIHDQFISAKCTNHN
jgi:hypothetical protein